MELYSYQFVRESDLFHYGTKGMHWGTRHWQNEDGTFNDAGYQRYFGRGSGENYHKIRKASGERVSPNATGGKKSGGSSFDKDKAKKIAKGVAIGAAVVGGTILVAYGAKHMKDLNISDKARSVTANIQSRKLENLKIKESFKQDVAKIKADSKAELAKIHQDGKLNIAAVKMDPEGRLNQGILKAEISKSNDRGKLKEFVRSLNDNEVDRINQGTASLQDIRKERAVNSWSPNQEKYADYYAKNSEYYDKATLAAKKAYSAVTSDKAKATYKQAANTVGTAAKKMYETATSDKAKETYKSAASSAGKVAKTIYKTATSDKAKETYKQAGKATANAAKTTANVAKSTVKVAKLAAQHPKETKAGLDYAMKLVNGAQSNAAVREYKHQHPNTKLSDQQIARNIGYGM